MAYPGTKHGVMPPFHFAVLIASESFGVAWVLTDMAHTSHTYILQLSRIAKYGTAGVAPRA